MIIDSGACDVVCPPSSFPNARLNPKDKEYGKCYCACGGETVRNIGCKKLRCLTGSGETHNYTFQVGDKITNPLLAVSKISETAKSVFFGPGPKYESYIVDDPEAFIACNGSKTTINLKTVHIYKM